MACGALDRNGVDGDRTEKLAQGCANGLFGQAPHACGAALEGPLSEKDGIGLLLAIRQWEPPSHFAAFAE
jgi:hypothetical protein